MNDSKWSRRLYLVTYFPEVYANAWAKDAATHVHWQVRSNDLTWRPGAM